MKKTFPKTERLHEKKLIHKLFNNGSSFYKHPFKVVSLRTQPDNGNGTKILLSVSKRNFKRAVDRNRIKRLMKEAYRVNKHLLINNSSLNNESLLIGLIYTGKTLPGFREIEEKIILILQELVKK